MTSTENIQLLPRRIAVVTGGTRGLGRVAVLGLARRGIDSIFTYMADGRAADDVVADVRAMGRRAVALALDTSDILSFNAFIRRLMQALAEFGTGRFDYLVNNAGVARQYTFGAADETELDAFHAMHVKGVFFLTHKLSPLINDGGRIVNLAAGAGRGMLPGGAVDDPVDGAVEMLSRSLARDLQPRRITVDVVASPF